MLVNHPILLLPERKHSSALLQRNLRVLCRLSHFVLGVKSSVLLLHQFHSVDGREQEVVHQVRFHFGGGVLRTLDRIAVRIAADIRCSRSDQREIGAVGLDELEHVFQRECDQQMRHPAPQEAGETHHVRLQGADGDTVLEHVGVQGHARFFN